MAKKKINTTSGREEVSRDEGQRRRKAGRPKKNKDTAVNELDKTAAILGGRDLRRQSVDEKAKGKKPMEVDEKDREKRPLPKKSSLKIADVGEEEKLGTAKTPAIRKRNSDKNMMQKADLSASGRVLRPRSDGRRGGIVSGSTKGKNGKKSGLVDVVIGNIQSAAKRENAGKKKVVAEEDKKAITPVKRRRDADETEEENIDKNDKTKGKKGKKSGLINVEGERGPTSKRLFVLGSGKKGKDLEGGSLDVGNVEGVGKDSETKRIGVKRAAKRELEDVKAMPSKGRKNPEDDMTGDSASRKAISTRRGKSKAESERKNPVRKGRANAENKN